MPSLPFSPKHFFTLGPGRFSRLGEGGPVLGGGGQIWGLKISVLRTKNRWKTLPLRGVPIRPDPHNPRGRGLADPPNCGKKNLLRIPASVVYTKHHLHGGSLTKKRGCGSPIKNKHWLNLLQIELKSHQPCALKAQCWWNHLREGSVVEWWEPGVGGSPLVAGVVNAHLCCSACGYDGPRKMDVDEPRLGKGGLPAFLGSSNRFLEELGILRRTVEVSESGAGVSRLAQA